MPQLSCHEMNNKQNSRTDGGGGIKIYNSTVEDNGQCGHCILMLHTSNYGGGVMVQQSTVTMNGVEITNKYIKFNGGIAYIQSEQSITH